MFVDREREFEFLNELLQRTRPTAAQLVLLYGRRRVGKTVLLRQWAESTGLPTIYWAAEPEPAPLQRRKLYARLLNVTMPQAPLFEAWDDFWNAASQLLGQERRILILDEIPYAAESDSAFLAALQHAWDHQLKTSNLILLLSGSHVHTMESFLARGAPLFGRFTGQWRLQPFAYGLLHHFVPRWAVEERIALYSIVGGVPAYLEWLDPNRSLVNNVRDIILSPGGVFLAEPDLLLYDELRDPRRHRSILQAIGSGAHTLDAIANLTLTSKTHLPAYLARLQELGMVERRLPVTISPNKRLASRMGRYHIADPFLRFYFRFIAPQRAEVGHDTEGVTAYIKEHLRAYVGGTAFEQLCRQWVEQESGKGRLPFQAQAVGSHWSRRVQIDVVGIRWQSREILLGECKWGTDDLSQAVVRELIEEKSPRVRQVLPDEGEGWKIYYALFSRTGFTPAAREFGRQHGAVFVDASQLDRDLKMD